MIRAVRKWAILIHRWMGVGFCVLFFTWFVSGMVLMYCPYPEVDAAQRLDHAGVLEPGKIGVDPQAAFDATRSVSPPSEIRLNLLAGRPVYRFTFGPRSAIVRADTGELLSGISREVALQIAAAWTRLSAAAGSFEGLIENDDQWTLDTSVRRYGPFWKFAWPDGEEIYVSQRSGEVIQDTTRSSRIGAYFGAIPHWLFFRPLRSRSGVWSQVVIWLSGAGTLLSILGLIVGFWVYSPSKSFRLPNGVSSLPYVGPKRWHVLLGLIFGLVTCTWVFSGLMSMGPFSWVEDKNQPDVGKALRGDHLDIRAFRGKTPGAAIRQASASLRVKELELSTAGGEGFYLASDAATNSVLVPISGDPQAAFATDAIIDIVKHGVAPAQIRESRVVKEYEAYYLDRDNRLPLPVLCIQLDDAAKSAYYVDPRTARVVESYGTRSRWGRWMYHGFHSLDLPWLYASRPSWDIVVLLLLSGGTALSVTSLIIALRVVRRKFLVKRRTVGA